MKKYLAIAAATAALSMSPSLLANPAKDTALTTPPSAAAQASRININSASVKELAGLPGIGMKKAAAIIAYREEHGDFITVDDLINVKGIGKASMVKLADKITI